MTTSAPSTPRTDAQVVLFVDLLGFAALTEQHSLDEDSIRMFDRPLSGDLDALLKAQGNSLTRTFGSFHRSLKHALELASMTHPVTAISFSDSAFIATRHLYEVSAIAIDVVQSLVTQRVPVRMGIAYGSFAALRFRSDVTQESGDHAAHFLGTAVVRAHATESCGIKGMRLLLHPSAVSLLGEPFHNPPDVRTPQIRTVNCSAAESDNAAGVTCEIDYWRFRPTAEADAWHAFQDMWTAAPPNVHNHYEATAQAINRMRMAQGAASLTNLRRRTLPRHNIK